MGHLFEHVLLEHLCIEKINAGHAYADYSGKTYWTNNARDGLFTIRITCPSSDQAILEAALEKTHALLDSLASLAQPKRTAVAAAR